MRDYSVSIETFEAESMKLSDVDYIAATVPKKTIRNWTDRGLIEISNPKPGTNKNRLYSLKNCIEVLAMDHFGHSGRNTKHSRILTDKVTQRAYELLDTSMSHIYDNRHVMAYWQNFVEINGIRHGEEDYGTFFCLPEQLGAWITKQQGHPEEFTVYHVDELLFYCFTEYYRYFDL